MSGGVDSSVSAALLKEAGYDAIGLFMKNWEDADGTCRASSDYEDVAKTCEVLQIPYYSVNFTEEYRQSVFAEFLADLTAGLTPNPDVLCNREIKFNVFLKKAMALDADFLATGHYCRLDAQNRLLKGSDPEKDQSYFLHAVEREAFQKVLFPIGHLRKREVRSLARKFALPTAEKKDSTGICFIGKRDFKTFLQPFLGFSPGDFKTLSGKIVGQHDGVAFYTIGQRRGLKLGGEGEAWYVVDKDLKHNVVYVERGASHSALFSSSLLASQLTWMGQLPSSYPFRCSAKIRYRQADQPCTLLAPEKGIFPVVFDQPERAITPGQFVVFYDGDLVLGGGIIEKRLN